MSVCPHCRQEVTEVTRESILEMIGDGIPLKAIIEAPVGTIQSKSGLLIRMVRDGDIVLNADRTVQRCDGLR
jgi:hypothetical protein